MAVVLCLCIHFVFGSSGTDSTVILLLVHVSDLTMSLSEQIVSMILFVVLLDLIHVDVSLVDDVHCQVIGVEGVGAIGVDVHARVRFELSLACGG